MLVSVLSNLVVVTFKRYVVLWYLMTDKIL